MPPIVDGLCTRAPLITASYKEGAGDKGSTPLRPRDTADIYRVPNAKGNSPLVDLWGQLSALQVTMGQTIPLFLEEDTRTFLTWVRDNLRSMSSLAYLDGATDTHSFPQEALTYMEHVIAHKKLLYGNSESFIQWDGHALLRMEDLWAHVRHTELIYQHWALTAPIQDSVLHKVQLIASIINRLSSYLWWQMRHENRLRGQVEHVWQGHVTPFPLQPYTNIAP